MFTKSLGVMVKNGEALNAFLASIALDTVVIECLYLNISTIKNALV